MITVALVLRHLVENRYIHSCQTQQQTSHPVAIALEICISSKRLRSKVRKKATKSEVNKLELFRRYSTFKASLSSNGFLFRLFETAFDFPGNLPTANLVILRTRSAFDCLRTAMLQCNVNVA